MNKKVLTVLFVSLAVVTSFVGIMQTNQASAMPAVTYRIEIKATKINLYDDGDSIGKGDLYMSSPPGIWPASSAKSYKGGFYAYEEGGIFYDYMVYSYDISDKGISTTYELQGYPDSSFTYTLMDKDLGADDQLYSGKVKISGTTNGWVTGWSGSKGATTTLAGGNVEIDTDYTRWATYKFTRDTGATIYTWWKTFTNQIYFEVRVTAIPML